MSVTPDKLITKSAEVMTRHDFWRSAYATLLEMLPPAEAGEFFKALPLALHGRELSLRELLELLWSDKAQITMDWNYRATNAVEPFLVERGVDAAEFMRRLLFRNNRATYIPGKVLLSWFNPLLTRLLTAFDAREKVYAILGPFTESYLPGHRHERIDRRTEGEWCRSTVVYATDRAYRNIIRFNFEIIAAPQILNSPRMMGLPEFERLEMLADCREAGEILWEGRLEEDADGLLLDGRRLAVRRTLSEHLVEVWPDLRKRNVPDREVMAVLEDVPCAKRKRDVLHKGCAYGAPAYVYDVFHQRKVGKERMALDHLIQDALEEGEIFSGELAERHATLLRSLERKRLFTYHPADESMSVDGEHFVKGVPAKILRNILQARLTQGRKDFEYRDFKRDFEISMGQKNSNFEVRFYRLMDRVREKVPEVRIEKAARGRFTVDLAGGVELVEAVGEGAHGG